MQSNIIVPQPARAVKLIPFGVHHRPGRGGGMRYEFLFSAQCCVTMLAIEYFALGETTRRPETTPSCGMVVMLTEGSTKLNRDALCLDGVEFNRGAYSLGTSWRVCAVLFFQEKR